MRLTRRMPGALISLMLLWGGDPPTSNVTTVHAAAADDDCLPLDLGRSGAAGFATSGHALGTCSASRLPLMPDAGLGSDRLFSNLELSNLDVGHMSAQEVKVKFGLARDLFAGFGATLDGSVGRLLGSIEPMFDEQLHAAVARSLDAHWDTGLEGRIAALGSVGLTQLTERTGLVFLRSRYTFLASRGDGQHQVTFKLSADAAQTTALGSALHQRADLRYEYHHGNNVISIGLNATQTESSSDTAAILIDLRATRRF